jgi:hypothetical protein
MASHFNSNSLNEDNSHLGSGFFGAIVVVFVLVLAAIALVNYGDELAEGLIQKLGEFAQQIPTYR